MSAPTTTESSLASTTDRSAYSVFGALTGIAALAVLLQGLWAGVFLQKDGQRDASQTWIDAHARGADVAILFAVLAVAWGLWKLRERLDLVIGAAVLAVLLLAESYLGGLIVDSGKDSLTVIHVPLAMALMGVAVWLPLRARAGRRA